MTETQTDVLVPGYQAIDAAQRDFDAVTLDRTVPVAFSSYAEMDIGRDSSLIVDRAYEPKAPYPFTGTVRNVVFELTPAPHEREKELHTAAAGHAASQGASG